MKTSKKQPEIPPRPNSCCGQLVRPVSCGFLVDSGIMTAAGAQPQQVAQIGMEKFS